MSIKSKLTKIRSLIYQKKYNTVFLKITELINDNPDIDNRISGQLELAEGFIRNAVDVAGQGLTLTDTTERKRFFDSAEKDWVHALECADFALRFYDEIMAKEKMKRLQPAGF